MKVVVVDSEFSLEKWLLSDDFKEMAEAAIAGGGGGRDGEKTKLLGTEFRISCLFMVDGVKDLITYRVPWPYVPIARTTGDVFFCVQAFFEVILTANDLRGLFEVVVRAVCADGATAIGLAERARSLLAENAMEATLQSGCRGHTALGHRVREGKLVEEERKGQKYLLLSVRFGNMMRLLRAGCRLALKQRMVARRGEAPCPMARASNLALLDLFLPDVAKNRERRTQLMSLLAGPWDDYETVPIFIEDYVTTVEYAFMRRLRTLKYPYAHLVHRSTYGARGNTEVCSLYGDLMFYVGGLS